MDTAAVLQAYKRWAPVYDKTFGLVSTIGRKEAVRFINKRKGRVLEVGVGTGLSLPSYADHLSVTGIDLSPEMLKKAERRVARRKLDQIEGLHQMDASALAFPDDSFETVVAMYVMTVVPDPVKVMAELERVCAPGGEVILVNHFSQEHGLRGWAERRLAPAAELIGWHPIFPVETVLVREDLKPVERRPLWPGGLFTMIRFVKQPGYGRGLEVAPVLVAQPARRKVFGAQPDSAGIFRTQATRHAPHSARLLVQARRLLDHRYWRSLYRRLASQLAD